MIRPVILCFLFSVLSAWLYGQSASNPFELKHRLQASAATEGHTGPANPFDVAPHRPPGVARTLAENTTTPFRPSRWLPRRGDTLSGFALFGILALIFTFMTLSVAANRKSVGKAWRGFLNENGLTVAQREASGFVGITPYLLLYSSFLLNAGIFMFLVVRIFRKESFNNFSFLLVCLLLSAVIFLSKHLILNITGWLFPVEKEVSRYNFLITIFNCILGLFLMPFNFLLAYAKDDYKEFLVFWTLGLVAIFYLYRAIRSGRISSKFLADHQFHFLLYLCAVEIAPVVLVAKLVMIQAK
ncbi:MAG: DUF4271 domain-containing protein [Saprospiraceae bacterium]|nr:DUF4271 domain-containing protein [Saprospiraceae bacterium]